MSLMQTRMKDTLVEKVYDKIRDTILEEKLSYYVVFSKFLPLLLAEVDKLEIIYPDAGDTLKDVFEKLWGSRFPDIPSPEINPNESGRDIQEKTYMKLYEHRHKLIKNVMLKTTKEMDEKIQKETVLFMDMLLRTFFKMYNVMG